MSMVEWRMGQEVPVEQRKKEQRCPHCTWIDVRGYSSQSTQWILGEPCAEHMDPLTSYYHREPVDDGRTVPAWVLDDQHLRLLLPKVEPRESTLADQLARCWHDAMAELDEIDRLHGLEP